MAVLCPDHSHCLITWVDDQPLPNSHFAYLQDLLDQGKDILVEVITDKSAEEECCYLKLIKVDLEQGRFEALDGLGAKYDYGLDCLVGYEGEDEEAE